MILYQALSSYQILECMLHRYFFYPNEHAVLLLGTYITERMPDYLSLHTQGFFDEICLFQFGGAGGKEEQILEKMEKELKKALPWKLTDFDRIFIAGIHTYLQVYMLHSGISFEMFEDGSGALSRPRILADIHRASAPGRYEIIEKYGLYDHTSPLITKKYCDMKSQVPGFFDERAVDFSILEYFRRLPIDRQEAVRRIFQVPALGEAPKEAVLLLTQQFASLGQLTFDEQILIYENLMDYYLRGACLIIKPHPDDILYYRLLFPEAQIIRGQFPSELLPLAFEKLPERAATISSTGLNLLKGEFSDILAFNAEYEKTFHFNHIYYAALSMACFLGMNRAGVIGANPVQLENLAERGPAAGRGLVIGDWEDPGNREEEQGSAVTGYSDGIQGPAGGETILFCDIAEEKGPSWKDLKELADRKAVRGILFFNTDKEYRMYEPDREIEPEEALAEAKAWFLRLIPIRVVKKRLGRRNTAGKGMPETADRMETSEYADREGEDMLYFYAAEEELRTMARQFETELELPFTGTKLTAGGFSPEQEKIKMLEGILAATERRLLEYIREERVLRQRLEEREAKT